MRFKSLRGLIFSGFLLGSLAISTGAHADPLDGFRALPLQDNGRIKPFDTFARESLALMTGKSDFEGRPAAEVVMTWLLQPSAWEEKKIVEIRYGLLKKTLKLNENETKFSLKEILNNERLSMVFQELQSKREAKVKLDPYFQALQRLETQLETFRGIATGDLLKFSPPALAQSAGPSAAWLGLPKLPKEDQEKFAELTKEFIHYLAWNNQGAPAADEQALKDSLDSAVHAFQDSVRAKNPEIYPQPEKIQAELWYNKVHPFRYAWILYLTACLMMLVWWMSKKSFAYAGAWLFAGLAIATHMTGFAARIYIAGRPPVSNMYETVVWVAFGVSVFAMVIEALYRWKFALFCGALVSGFCLILADNAPVVLDPSLQPLQAVLNSNFWLTTHVLTITVSYAAFFLAFALGDIGLIFYIIGDDEKSPRVQAIVLSIYRAMQIGVSLLAPGIILGGIWADYSWGRFWGWDPKETWALIALLGYIAVLHARMAGMVKSFGFVCISVITFSLVIMAWYGVNYVLGAGLHSYGFGAGGVEYVAGFIGIHLVAVVFASVLVKLRAQAP
jgi:ABC-type transport system involved in cytochrome c biogenesis permease subunit